MWPRNRGGGSRPGRPARPVVVAGSNFLQSPAVGSVLGRRRQRQQRRHATASGLAPSGLRSPGSSSTTETVTCIACGASVPRDEAREYDKHGDRWDRDGKRFEHLCKRCHRELDHQPRGDLEALLVEFEARDRPDEAFVEWYCDRVEERYGPLEDDR